ncbi:MAG: hypothetical protein AB7E59_04270 [Pusillimonas sp.]
MDRLFIEFKPPVDRKDKWGDLAMLPYFGLRHLSIIEAARLIAIDTWYAGRIEIDDAKDVSDDALNYPRLIEMLSEHIVLFQKRLSDAVVGGWLNADIGRDIDGKVIPERTFIERDDLTDWLFRTGHDYDDIVAEWMEVNDEASARVAELARHYRGVAKKDAIYGGEFEEVAPIIFDLKAENAELKRQLDTIKEGGKARVDRPVTTRQRRTFLTIIAALCDYSAINPNERGTAGQIAAMTEAIGAPITAETIGGLLKEIPDALETRMK